MGTVATAPAARAQHPAAYDRLFYSSLAIVMALTVVAGFGGTYYFAGDSARTLSGGPITPMVRAHAFLFTAWVLLFVVQTALIARRRVAVHRRMGIAGVLLAAAMAVVGVNTARAAAARGAAPPGADPLAFVIVPLFDMVLFVGFVGTAVAMRRNREAHKRLMLLAYISIITAAIARLPGVLPLGPPVFFGVTLLLVVAGIVYDRWSRGRVHPVYVWGGGLLALSVPLRLALSATPVWRSFAAWFTSGG